MAVDLVDFQRDLMQEVAARAVARGEHTRTVLVEELVERLMEAEELQDWSPAYFEGTGYRRRNIGLDGYSIDELTLDGTLQVIVAEPRESAGDVATLGTADIRSAFARATSFVDDAIRGRLIESLEPSTPAADLARIIEGQRSLIKKLRVLLLTNGTLGSRFKEIDYDVIQDVKVELNVWDLTRFHQLSEAGGREEVDIDLTMLIPGGLTVLPAGIGDTGYSAYLGVVPGSLLADLYEQYGSRLLEGNVRAFLSTRGKVNKGIRRTITTSPDCFFAFNNGITATATGADVEQDGGSIQLRRVRDLQIVNGGQTTASLFNARERDKANLAGVFVQMKLSVLPPEVAETMIPEISRYANTQNRVSDADLFANHPFHRKVEELSRRIWAPPKPGAHQMTHWFFERARAQYQTEQLKLRPAGKREFLLQHPKDQVITKTDLAKFENTWSKLPHVVSFGAQKNFIRYAEGVRERYDSRPTEFNERWFQHLVAKAILFRATERLVSSATWYTGGYRANIVTYGLARFVRLVEESYPKNVLDLDRLWRSQKVPDATADQLVLCTAAAFKVLTNPPEYWSNVTEWAKKEQCWQAVESTAVALVPGLLDDLKPLDEERAEQRHARGQEREDVTISAQVEVVRLAAEGYWRRAAESPISRRVLSGVEFGVVQTAARRTGWVPTDAQARRLMAARKRLEEEGLT